MTDLSVVGRQMSADEARALTNEIKGALTVAYDGLIRAWQGRADLALGYTSWDEYCSREFAEGRMVRLEREQRREIVGQMREAEMSIPAIASGLGVSVGTVHNDLQAFNSESLPPVAKGIDGKTYSHVNRSTGEIDPDHEDDDDEPALTQEECEALDSPRQPYRRPLPDAFFDAAYELTKAVERIQRLVNDDRFPRNAEQVAAKYRSDLLRAHGVLADAIDRFPQPNEKDTP